ncbi:hypothetical protein [Ruoffia tabacinasalis]|uniref:Uncharacterized protein n=1 Tax=Ruoffia tabacinasalis TaxID=87458 RepID=A0ABS0LM98_9LACT|nr:hypothetical protein [Ruoffia tabacinasalis]MBG9979222.1 hypothetical protein [Ruoffia tabacinasalis]
MSEKDTKKYQQEKSNNDHILTKEEQEQELEKLKKILEKHKDIFIRLKDK